LTKMKNIDFEIENAQRNNKVKPLCLKGCSDCCSDYFYVSRIEYYAIKSYILNAKPDLCELVVEKAKEQNDILKASFPEEYGLLSSRTKLSVKCSGAADGELFENHIHLERFLPCVLLDENGRCSCYSTRPFICRLHGTSSQVPACIKMLKKYRHRRLEKNLVDVKYSEELKTDMDFFGYNNALYVNIPFPLFYWFANDDAFAQDFYDAVSMDVKKYNSNIVRLHA